MTAWRSRRAPGGFAPELKVFAILERRCSDALTAPTFPPTTAGAALCAPPPTRPRRIKNHTSDFPKNGNRLETGGRGDGDARRKNRRVDGGVTCVSKSVTNSKGDAPLIEGEGRLR